MIILKDEGSIDLVKHLTVLLSQLDLMECNYKLSITPCSVSNIRQGYNNGLVKMEQIVKLDKMKTSCYQNMQPSSDWESKKKSDLYFLLVITAADSIRVH